MRPGVVGRLGQFSSGTTQNGSIEGTLDGGYTGVKQRVNVTFAGTG